MCPVPWAKGVEALKAAPFLTQDRDSNFPGENTIQGRPEISKDEVNHPEHYTDGGIECIDAIEAALTEEEFRGYLKGNIIKYVWRERKKGGMTSMRKAGWYTDRFLSLEG